MSQRRQLSCPIFCLGSKSLKFDSEVMWRYNLFAISQNFHHLGTTTPNTMCQLKKKMRWVKREHIYQMFPRFSKISVHREKNLVLLFSLMYYLSLAVSLRSRILGVLLALWGQETLINSINMQLKPKLSLCKTNEWVGTVACVVAHFLMP